MPGEPAAAAEGSTAAAAEERLVVAAVAAPSPSLCSSSCHQCNMREHASVRVHRAPGGVHQAP